MGVDEEEEEEQQQPQDEEDEEEEEEERKRGEETGGRRRRRRKGGAVGMKAASRTASRAPIFEAKPRPPFFRRLVQPPAGALVHGGRNRAIGRLAY